MNQRKQDNGSRKTNEARVRIYAAAQRFLDKRGMSSVVHAPSRRAVPRFERAPEEVWTDAARGLLENPPQRLTQDRHSFRDN